MTYDFNPFRVSLKDVITELLKIFDEYGNERMTHDEFEDSIIKFMRMYYKSLVTDNGNNCLLLKGSAVRSIGKKRIIQVGRCLQNSDFLELTDIDNFEFKHKLDLDSMESYKRLG